MQLNENVVLVDLCASSDERILKKKKKKDFQENKQVETLYRYIMY